MGRPLRFTKKIDSMNKNLTLDISTGTSAGSRMWKNKKIKWVDLVKRLRNVTVTNETYKEFIDAESKDQSKIKDVGGFVGGYLRGGRRSPKNVIHRQVLSLDLDFAHMEFWEDFQIQFDCSAVIHSTHKHSKKAPRFRLVIPLSKEVSPDEHEAIARWVAGELGIDYFDKTTFEVNRLMFWPSVSKDSEYYFKEQRGDFLEVDYVLKQYTDWTDSSLWPTVARQFDEVYDRIGKQEDPETKRGIVGLFCRTYPIQKAIEVFLGEDYIASEVPHRYTYSKGSTSGGLIIYEDKFAFSHHGTDPVSGKLCNSFDLVRIHRFGYLDEGSRNGKETKSYKAIEKLILEDENVKKKIAKENIEKAKYDFGQIPITVESSKEENSEEDPTEWMKDLEINSRGEYLSIAPNLNLIFMNDPRLNNLFKQNEFDGKRYVFRNLPWRKIKSPEAMKNVDYSGTRNYIESIYNITGNLKIDDSMALEFERNKYHPILKYLKELEWDGLKRVDNLLIDYLGAENSLYSKESIRKMLVGAVSRIFDPGCKFDLVLTLVGEQGTGKSTFVKRLGRQWFSDTFLTVQGKEALEQIQGAWIIEMAELSGLRKAEVEAVKHFISKQEDVFRPAYARTSETYKRQCVFVGTTNNKGFLRDPSGNRRFLPVDINPLMAEKDIFKDFTEDIIDQVWAESVQMFKNKEPLFLSKAAEILAKQQQREHSDVDERSGLIEKYLETLLPKDWKDLDIYERRSFLDDPLSEKGTEERDFVCVAEVWVECLGKEREDMDRYKTRELNEILRSLENWERVNSTKNFKLYGKQKYYSRKLD